MKAFVCVRDEVWRGVIERSLSAISVKPLFSEVMESAKQAVADDSDIRLVILHIDGEADVYLVDTIRRARPDIRFLVISHPRWVSALEAAGVHDAYPETFNTKEDVEQAQVDLEMHGASKRLLTETTFLEDMKELELIERRFTSQRFIVDVIRRFPKSRRFRMLCLPDLVYVRYLDPKEAVLLQDLLLCAADYCIATP